MKYSLSSHSYAFNRRSKEGDWICLKCANYNYAFRRLCNRCQQQERELNQHWLNLLGVVHYGELSFPSVLFLNNENNLYYKNHHESQENPENHKPHPHLNAVQEYPLISAPDRPPISPKKPKIPRLSQASGSLSQKRPVSKIQCLQRGGEEGLWCRKWINELLD